MDTSTVIIDFDRTRPEKANSAFLAVLAYPEDRMKAQVFRGALLSMLYVKIAAKDPKWQPQSIEPGYLLAWEIEDKDRDQIYNIYNKGLTRIESRLLAADMASLMLADEIGGDHINIRIDGEVPKVNPTARYAARLKHGVEEPTDGAESNIKSREWASTKPVLHMALAYRSIVLENPGDQIDPLEQLERDDWIEKVVAAAEALQAVIVGSARFRAEDIATVSVALR